MTDPKFLDLLKGFICRAENENGYLPFLEKHVMELVEKYEEEVSPIR